MDAVEIAGEQEERDVADQQTCGTGLAANSVVPMALADVAGGMARNLEVHMRAIARDDPAGAREHAVYERVARGLHEAAAALRAAGTEMADARDLPPAPHDMAAMTSPDVVAAFERYVAAADDLGAMLGKRREQNDQMLAAMRADIGGH